MELSKMSSQLCVPRSNQIMGALAMEGNSLLAGKASFNVKLIHLNELRPCLTKNLISFFCSYWVNIS